MFLFIHGTLATPSLWLPHIRSTLSLGAEFSDRELINAFTLQLPGHPDKDAVFTYKDFREYIAQFRKSQYVKQKQIAQKLIMRGNKQVVQGLQDKRLIIIGHSVGGALSLEYAIKNSNEIIKLVLVSTPNQFNLTYLRSIRFTIWTLNIFSKGMIRVSARILPFKRWRVAASLLEENPKQLGFRSCITYLLTYDFESLYSISSLNDQLHLSRIPILLIGGSYDLVAPSYQISKLKKLLSPDTNLMKSKKTVIKGNLKYHEPVTKIIYNAGHNAMDSRPREFVADVQEFLFD
jgi:pimeloyl-ACP methyl ester carboxylesterase